MTKKKKCKNLEFVPMLLRYKSGHKVSAEVTQMAGLDDLKCGDNSLFK